MSSLDREFETLKAKLLAAGFHKQVITHACQEASQDRAERFDALSSEEKAQVIKKLSAVSDGKDDDDVPGKATALNPTAIYAKFNGRR